MKTKFTLLIIAGLFFAAGTQAQGRNFDNNHRRDLYKSDFRHERHDDFDYRNRMYILQQRSMHEMNKIELARKCER